MRPPKFSNYDAVYALVCKIIDDDALADEALAAADDAERDHPPISVVVTPASVERAAIERAKRGNFKPLADLLEEGSLGREALALIASKLRRTFKAEKGALKKTSFQRDLDPKHEAAEDFEKAVVILRRYYGKQWGLVERAIDIAADRDAKRAAEFAAEFGIKRRGMDREKLRNYVLKSPRYLAWKRAQKRPT